MNPKDVIINHYYLGPGKGSSFKMVHVPTGVFVGEAVPAKSTESGKAITERLFAALKLKINDHDNVK